MIRDREDGIAKDFDTSPVSKWSVIGGYLLNSMVIGTVMSIISFVIAEIYIVVNGGSLVSPVEALQVVGIIVVSVFSAAGLVGLLSSFITSEGAFSGANIAIGSAIGFLVGAYFPIGDFPDAVQSVVKLLPAPHAARALRVIMMEDPTAAAFEGAPAQAVEQFNAEMGVSFQIGDHVVTMAESIG